MVIVTVNCDPLAAWYTAPAVALAAVTVKVTVAATVETTAGELARSGSPAVLTCSTPAPLRKILIGREYSELVAYV